MKQTGVGKIRENINNLKTMSPLGTTYYSHQVPVGGGGGLLQYYRALEVGGGKENQANFIGHNKNCPPSPS